ncbi:MAG: ABC transporter permease [Anaerolineales bacterium]|nr:ABC transporter permease [Anaerolineales bacterium]MCB9128092.1 ABC transporter permease [Ardenticatenales bacterium]MCB9172106.1 ABC transporter permease [Ardenticatenales bacterium]
MAQATLVAEQRRALPSNLIWGIVAVVAVIATFYFYGTRPAVTTAILASALRQATPLVLGALSGLYCERSGVINIGIEGMMLVGAFVAFLTNVYTANLFLATVVGVASGVLTGLLHAFLSVTIKMDQIISGTIINILALELTGFFYQAGLTTQGKLTPVAIPLLSDIPLIGPVLFNNPPITYLSIILVIVTHILLFRTVWGLRTRAVGEHPRAADTVGIDVIRTRYINVMLGGALAGLAGAYLTLEAVGSFERAMTNGRGFVALAVMIFGKWTPLGAWGAALLFGLANALQTQAQFSNFDAIPHQFVGMLPYILTIVVLAGFVGRAHPPAAIGQPYDKE